MDQSSGGPHGRQPRRGGLRSWLAGGWWVARPALIRIKHFTRKVLAAVVPAAEPRVDALVRDDAL
jgi:hypothetical protein